MWKTLNDVKIADILQLLSTPAGTASLSTSGPTLSRRVASPSL